MNKELKVQNLSVNIENKKVLDDISFNIKKGEVCVLMGPNGAGKSTVSNVLLGNEKFKIEKGDIFLDNSNITNLKPNERAKQGLFMSFQHPTEISGVTYTNFLRQSYNILKGENLNLGEFVKLLEKNMSELDLDKKFKSRFVNKGFSGGEKKKFEILQLMIFEPKYAILDEIDSGLDVDGLKEVCKQINNLRKKLDIGLLIITHHSKILEYIKPDKVLVLKKGKISQEGDYNLAKQILEKGYN